MKREGIDHTRVHRKVLRLQSRRTRGHPVCTETLEDVSIRSSTTCLQLRTTPTEFRQVLQEAVDASKRGGAADWDRLRSAVEGGLGRAFGLDAEQIALRAQLSWGTSPAHIPRQIQESCTPQFRHDLGDGH